MRLAACALIGFLAGPGAVGLVHPDPRSGVVSTIASAALVIILFRDGVEVEGELLRKAWHPPLRKLVIGMPVTAAIVALATHTFTDLGWTRSFLVGALLSPTDPILSSGVVTNPRVPSLIRHSLNLESGLNDGLALPPIVALAAVARTDPSHITVGSVAEDVLFLVVFVVAIALGALRSEDSKAFGQRIEPLVEVAKCAVFLVFGSLLTIGGLFEDGWAAVGIVAVTLLLARPVAIFAALAGTGISRDRKVFMAWFGPKGVATLTFAILLLNAEIPANGRIFHIASLAVVVSLVVFWLTDRPGVDWLLRREARPAPGRSGTPTPPSAGAPAGT